MFGEIGQQFTQAMMSLLDGLKGLTGSYGWSIVIFSVIVKLVLYPLTQSQYKSMKQMQKLQPHIKKLQDKYKDDQQKMQIEQMALFKKHNINPLGGCLPILFQMPILIGIFYTIRKMAELGKFSGETFLWIGSNISTMYPNIFGTSLAFKDIPLLVVYGFSMYLSQKLSVTDPNTQETQKIMNMVMPIFFTVILWNFPSALILYWLVFNVLSIVQQYYIMKAEDDIDISGVKEESSAGKNTNIEGEEGESESDKSRSRSRKKKGGK